MSATLVLDPVGSDGKPVRPVRAMTRLMVLQLRPEPLWFGCVVKRAAAEAVLPGSASAVDLCFFNDADARRAFVPGASTLFGDGVSTWGVLRFDPF